jgi:hypothetical protein
MVMEDLQEGIESSASRLLGDGVVDQGHDAGHENLVLSGARLLEPLAKAADRNASSLPDGAVGILETSLNEGPDLIHEGSHKLAAALDGNAEREHGAATVSGVRRLEELEDEVAQRNEDLVRRKVGSEAINYSEGRLSREDEFTMRTSEKETHSGRSVVVDVFRLSLGSNRHQTFKDGGSETKALDL